MAGMTVKVISKYKYDFSGLGIGNSAAILAAKGVDLSLALSGELVVRLHDFAFGKEGVLGSINVVVKADAPTMEDPSNDFTAQGYALAQVNIGAQQVQSFPDTLNAYAVPLIAPLPQMARVYVVGYQGSVADADLNATLSADLVLHW